MLNTPPRYTGKMQHAPLGIILIMCISLLCAGLPGKVAYEHTFSRPLGIEKVFAGTDFRPQTQLMRTNMATSYDRS
jgi:hypothetical protein